MNTNTIDNVKNQIKEHTAITFGPADITCASDRMHIGDNFIVPQEHIVGVMEATGIRKNLTKDIFKKPLENWPAFSQALDSIDKQKRFGAIVNKEGRVVSLLRKAPKENEQLNYDTRIDQYMNSLDTAKHDLQNIRFIQENATIQLHAVNRSQVDTGLENDLWQFGTTTDLDYTSNQFAHYFLRLICTNGMTTREDFAYRQVERTADVGKQFINFAKDDSIAKSIKPRVQMLQNNRASFAEIKAIADQLTKDQVDDIMPWYRDIVNQHRDRGVDLMNMSSKRQRYVYTNENAYDIFNLATSIATHRTDEVGSDVSLALNKRAGEMFIKGPHLSFSTIDIYNN